MSCEKGLITAARSLEAAPALTCSLVLFLTVPKPSSKEVLPAVCLEYSLQIKSKPDKHPRSVLISLAWLSTFNRGFFFFQMVLLCNPG